MKISAQTLWFGLALCVSAASHAQVYKCPDPANNRTVYSDRPCTGDGVQLERKRSQAEIEYDRQRAASEYQKFQAGQQREAAREKAEQRQRYQQAQQAPSQPAGRSPECTRAQRDLEFASSSISGSDDQRAASIAAANRKVDLACLGAAKAGSIRAAEAGAPKVEVNNYGNQNNAQDDRPKWCQGGYCW